MKKLNTCIRRYLQFTKNLSPHTPQAKASMDLTVETAPVMRYWTGRRLWRRRTQLGPVQWAMNPEYKMRCVRVSLLTSRTSKTRMQHEIMLLYRYHYYAAADCYCFCCYSHVITDASFFPSPPKTYRPGGHVGIVPRRAENVLIALLIGY